MDTYYFYTEGLTVGYHGVPLIKDIRISLKKGEILTLIGPNGAGKTTLLSALTAQMPVDAGTVTYGGAPVWENEAVLGELCFSRELGSTVGGMNNALKVKDYLNAGRLFYPHWDEAYAQKLITQFKLAPKKKISALSKGMASMLTIVLALASRAPITFMDEPVAGLDVVAREDFYRLLLDDYAETGRTFVISTHILEEASNVFEKVLIMKEGRLIEACDADELLAQFCAVTGRDDVVNKACAGLNILHTETLGRQKSCVVRVPAETMAAKGLDVDCTSLPLQKVFVALCGHEQELQEHREG